MAKKVKVTVSQQRAPSKNAPPTHITIKHNSRKQVLGGRFVNRWWLEPEEKMHQDILGMLATLDNRQAFRRFANLRWLKLYSNFDTVGLVGGTYSRLMPSSYYSYNSGYRFTLNVVENCVDAAAAQIAKSRPLPKIITSKGKFKQQRRAKLLNKYLKGLFETLEIHAQGQQAFIDACIWGTGCIKLFIEDGQLKAQRVCIDDIIIDEEDGRDGKPRQMHQRGMMNRDVLLELFPDKAEKIALASSGLPGSSVTSVSQDLVAVTESWHLRSAEDADDGKHVISIDNCTLVAEQWDHDWFPFAFLRWKPRPLSFYGTGLAEQLSPIQVELNKICALIQESIQRQAIPTIFVNTAANVIADHLGEKIGGIIPYEGSQPPSFVTPNGQSADVYAYKEDLYRKAYEITGISQLSAQSKAPPGFKSGIALQEYADIQTARFELTGQRYEDFYCDLSKKIVALSKDLYQDAKDLSVSVKGKNFIETIDWKDVDLEDDEFDMEMFPVSSLPNSPAGRLQYVQTLVEGGYIDKTMSLELLNFPDLDRFVALQVAALEDATRMVDEARWEGIPQTVTKLQDIKTLSNMAHSSYLDALTMDTPEKNKEILINIIKQCKDLTDEATAEQAAQQQAASPLGTPAAPPVAEMLPMKTAQ